MVFAMLIDDVRDPLERRSETRKRVLDALDEPLENDVDDRLEKLRDSWGTSDEAIANQQSSFWDN